MATNAAPDPSATFNKYVKGYKIPPAQAADLANALGHSYDPDAGTITPNSDISASPSTSASSQSPAAAAVQSALAKVLNSTVTANPAAADADRDPGTGLTSEAKWRDAFGAKLTPAQVSAGDTASYDPKAAAITRAIASSFGAPVRDARAGSFGTVTAGQPFYTTDPNTNQPSRNVTDGSGGYFAGTSPQLASDIGNRYVTRDKDGYPVGPPGAISYPSAANNWLTNALSGMTSTGRPAGFNRTTGRPVSVAAPLVAAKPWSTTGYTPSQFVAPSDALGAALNKLKPSPLSPSSTSRLTTR